MPKPDAQFINSIYAAFDAPITAFDCGEKCAPYNQNGVPFCCDTRHAVPTAYDAEWQLLQASTTLWRRWQGPDAAETQRLQNQTPAGQMLIECQGHTRCQRPFRAVTCRAFPFFPYITREKEFIGLSYYWAYEERCWAISHLDQITPEYRQQFVAAYEQLFAAMPEELATFHHHSTVMRRVFGRHRRAILLLHRNGNTYKVSPGSGRLRRVPTGKLPAFGPYAVANSLPFPDEF